MGERPVFQAILSEDVGFELVEAVGEAGLEGLGRVAVAFPSGVTGPLGGGAEVAEGKVAGEAVLDGVVLAAVVGLPAEEAGGGGEAHGAETLSGGEVEEVARGVVVTCIAEVVAARGLEDGAQKHGWAQVGLGQQLDIERDIHVAAVVARIFRRVGGDVARRVHRGVGLPEFHHRHPHGQSGAVTPEREVQAQEGVVGAVESVGQPAVEIVTREFHGAGGAKQPVAHLRHGEGVRPEPQRRHFGLGAEIGGDDGCAGEGGRADESRYKREDAFHCG